ncbi:restin [Reticulomyxa filosa]|uniref:Restin n=1 Tax=Reticulomyxa filosa TaxID=46433 RepID=X6N2M3_RETFI|nr:restin [Reticulomyxa filosa]|eukprot:ETO19979.1 restin [Reticulomyxa filosa]
MRSGEQSEAIELIATQQAEITVLATRLERLESIEKELVEKRVVLEDTRKEKDKLKSLFEQTAIEKTQKLARNENLTQQKEFCMNELKQCKIQSLNEIETLKQMHLLEKGSCEKSIQLVCLREEDVFKMEEMKTKDVIATGETKFEIEQYNIVAEMGNQETGRHIVLFVVMMFDKTLRRRWE